MASEWRKTTLGEIIRLKRGYDLPQRERVPGKVPIVSSSGISDFHSVAKVRGPGVVTGRYGTVGEVFYIPEDYWPLNTALYVEEFKGNDRRFISYFLKTINWSAYSDKAAVPGINRNHVHEAEVIVPPLPEQRRIAAILSAFDDKIELNRRINATLEAMARALFKSWFVDFDPVRAKQEGRPTGLPGEIGALFPDGFVDSELGEIPRGWRVGRFAELAEIIGGGTPRTSIDEYWNGEIPWVSAKDVTNSLFRFVLDTERTISSTGLKYSSAKILPAKTTIITARGTVGSICLLGREMAMNQTNYGLKAKADVGPYFIFLQTANLLALFQQSAYGTIFDTITTRILATSKILRPPNSVVQRFETLVTPPMDIILNNQWESKSLESIRDSLLPLLMRGELKRRIG